KLNNQFGERPKFARDADRPDTGFFAARVAPAAQRAKADPAKSDGAKDMDKAAAEASVALRNQLTLSMSRGMRGDAGVSADRKATDTAVQGTPAFMKRFGGGGKQPQAAKNADKKQGENERRFAYEPGPDLVTDTLLWHPNLWLADGSAEIRFVIGAGDATYRVLLLGHSPTGRFGFFEKRLDVGR